MKSSGYNNMPTTRIQLPRLTYLLQGKWQPRVIWVVNLLLVVYLVYKLVQIIQLFIPVPQEQDSMESDPVSGVTLTKRASRLSAKDVAEMHLFGVPVTEQASAEPTPIEAPDTHLKVVLHGTFFSDDPRSTFAIIADASGKEESYAVEDEVQGEVKVHEILADRVILERNQRYETLRLLRDEIKGVDITSGLESMHKTGHPSDPSGLPTLKGLPDSLNDLVSPQPVRMGGKFTGFRLKPLKDSDLLDKLGLQREDVIQWINEVDLDNPMKGMRAIKSISSGDYVNMTVRRKGQDISLSFHMP